MTEESGSGKCFVLNTVGHYSRRCYAPTIEQLLNATFVEITALTRVTARLVNGKAIRSAFAFGDLESSIDR